MDPLIIVSADGHASMPPKLWEHYLEKEYHDLLPRLRKENEIYNSSMWLLNNMMMSEERLEVCDADGVYRAGRWSGMWDLDVRLEEMDREGVAAEFVFYGDFRTSDLFINMMNGKYPPEAMDAGARAYDRWANDTFGPAKDRLLITGGIGSGLDRDALISELHWIADHGFVGTYAPGYSKVPGLLPFDDEYWDPVWATYAELGLALIVHGGYGFAQGRAYEAIEDAHSVTKGQGKSDEDFLMELFKTFNHDFFTDIGCRAAYYQLLMGGVFDRHPDFKVIFTEIRGDWMPATLEHLDKLYAERRDSLAQQRPPSEYWQSNCMAGLSFMHRAEVDIRNEIGVDKICFGRDYPHTEATWPNTLDYYKLLFHGVPEEDTRKILGENMIEFLGLDRAALAKVAEPIAPSVESIIAADAADGVDPRLVEILADRCGLEKPVEGGERLDALDQALLPDLDRMAGAAR
jgi:predicted TIM-barrel fold metal-dependent hydrolase